MNVDFFRQAVAIFGFMVFPYQLIQLVAKPDPALSPDQRVRKALLMVFFMILFAQWFVPKTMAWFSVALTLIMLVYLVSALFAAVRKRIFRLED